MPLKNNSKTKVCIAVIGPEGAGKRTVTRQIKKGFSNQPIHDPILWKTKNPVSAEPKLLQKLDFKLFSDFDHGSLGFPMRYGLIILTVPQVSDFSKKDALAHYFHFFEFIQKLSWFGVDQYVVAITRMDWIQTEGHRLFGRLSNWIKQHFEKLFRIKIKHCIPLALEHNRVFDNLVELNSKGVLTWYQGPTLMQALTDLTDCRVRSTRDLWILGRICNVDQGNMCKWITTYQTRGELNSSEQVKLFPFGIDAVTNMNDQSIVFNIRNFSSRKIGSLESQRQCVMISSNGTANMYTAFDLHVVLSKQYSHYNFNKEKRSYRFTFFGPQIIEGEIERCTPLRIAEVSPDDDLYVPLDMVNGDKIQQRLGKEVYLRVYCRKPVVADLWHQDKDAGRVLIWDQRVDKDPTLLGVGHILGSPDFEIQDCVEKILFLDQIRQDENPQANIIIYKFEKIYHDLKGFMTNNADELDLDDIKLRIKSSAEDFDQILLRTRPIQNEIKENRLPAELHNLHVHLERLKGKILEQLDDLAELLEQNAPLAVINERLKYHGKDFDRNVKFIRNHTVTPIRRCIAEAERKLTNEIKPKVAIHSIIPMDFSYYPVKANGLDNIHDAFCQLFDNSRKYAGRDDDLRIDVFVDPPMANKLHSVRIQYQDNGLLTNEVLKKIRGSKSGIESLKTKLVNDGIELKECAQLGIGTSFTIEVSVWSQRFNKIDDIAIEIMEIVNDIDFEYLSSNNDFKDYLGAFEKIISGWSTVGSLECLCNFLSSITKLTTAQAKCLERYRQNLLFSIQPKSKKELKHVETCIHHLRRDPVAFTIRKSIDAINQSFGQQIIRMKNPSKRIPQHRIKSFRTSQFFEQALIWGVGRQILPIIPVGQEITASIDLEHPENHRNHQIICTFNFPEIQDQDEFFIGLRTRLYHLGVKTIIESRESTKLVIFVPIIIPFTEGTIK